MKLLKTESLGRSPVAFAQSHLFETELINSYDKVSIVLYNKFVFFFVIVPFESITQINYANGDV